MFRNFFLAKTYRVANFSLEENTQEPVFTPRVL